MQVMSDKNSDVQRRLDLNSENQKETEKQLKDLNKKIDILLYINKITPNQYDLTKN